MVRQGRRDEIRESIMADALPEGFEPVQQAAPAPVNDNQPGQVPEGFEPVPASAYEVVPPNIRLKPITAEPPAFLERLAQGARVQQRLSEIWKQTSEGFG